MTSSVSREVVTSLVSGVAYPCLATHERLVPLHRESSCSHEDRCAGMALDGTYAIVNFGTQPQ